MVCSEPDETRLKMQIQTTVIDHLGIQLYSHLAPVICELIANSWDADARNVWIEVPGGLLREEAQIVVSDDGTGMTYDELRTCYLQVGLNRRKQGDTTPGNRKVIGRKGLGKLSVFGVAEDVVVDTVKAGRRIAFRMSLPAIRQAGDKPYYPEILCDEPVDPALHGTKIVLEKLKRRSPIDVDGLRRRIARRFTVMGPDFRVYLNSVEITEADRGYDLEFRWDIDECIDTEGKHRVRGWIGTTPSPLREDEGKGIIITARGKLVHEPTFFEAGGKAVAYAYMVGVLEADYLDDDPDKDLISTARSSLIADAEEVRQLFQWGRKKLADISEQWSKLRREAREAALKETPWVAEWYAGLHAHERALANKVIKVLASVQTLEEEKKLEYLEYVRDSIEHRALRELVEQFTGSEDEFELLRLFKEWEVLEAKEMLRVVEGRLATIKKFEVFVKENAREVPTLHRFFSQFPWMLDPRWTVWKDEASYAALLKERFPEDDTIPEENRRIDFLAVGFGETLNVIELKRPQTKVNKAILTQAQEYFEFAQTYVRDGDRFRDVKAYVVAGGIVDNAEVKTKRDNLRLMGIHVLYYSELLDRAKRMHEELIEKYETLKQRAAEQRSAEEASIGIT